MNDKNGREEIIKNAYLSGGEKGFEALYNCYYGDIYYFMLNMSADCELALDITHDVFIKAYNQKGITDYKIKAWLFKVAVNEFFSYRRSYTAKIKYYMKNIYRFIEPANDAGAEFFERIKEADDKIKLRESLKKLDEKDRAVITLRYYNDFSYEQIASALEIEPGTVMSRLHRAKERLKEVMINEAER
jgi:RNA polymerase sigma-70 factor (ECF subfamily)